MMVRINLLPGKRRSTGGAQWQLVAVMLILLVAELIVLYFVNDGMMADLTQRQGQLAQAQSQVQTLTAQVSSLPKAKERAAELESREAALSTLMRQRYGPQHVLDELKRLLSRPRARAAIRQAKAAQWNVAWDAENVFLLSFGEEEHGKIEILGYARTLDDIAEFWMRLRSSKLFRNIKLASIKEAADNTADVELQKFEFHADVNFNYETKEGRALRQQLEAAENGGEEGAAPDVESPTSKEE